MPSINRPSWRGVSTSSEDSTINYITERLRNLQDSTRLIRANLSNLIQHDSTLRSPEIEQIIGSPNEEINDSDLPDANTLTQNVEDQLERNGELKRQVEEVLESNVSLKLQVQEFLEENEKWKEDFLEETQQLDAQMEVILDTSDKRRRGVSSDGPSESEGLLVRREKSQGWMKSAGSWCVSAVSNILSRTLSSCLTYYNDREYPLDYFCGMDYYY